ncbi:unnamed protein product [Paramecium primaurelia]|uniref:polynucleotide adenylyltransferase n=2 Tax=Paramecium TaxID=5884 RepID=A0A8S1S5D4_9CILI|nr:unnamed protein product [Paramecium primaurelia]CAD8134783.1 unnamed protein product [Paramecium pentaurelia]
MKQFVSPQDMLNKFRNPHEIYTQQTDFYYDPQSDANIPKILQQSINFFDDEISKKTKDKLIEELRQNIIRWLKLYQSVEQEFAGELAVFGSYRFGANGKDSDIDLIILAPPQIDRELHFFQQLPSILSSNSKVTNLYCIQEAMVPLIRFKFAGIQFDLVFACVKKIMKPLSQSDPVDEKSSRSLNGLKVSDYFSKYCHQKSYLSFLKFIKAWAINRGIYGNVMGYLGGISWQILTHKIFQLYPNYSVQGLIERFFFIFSQWKWNELPVVIQKCDEIWRNSLFEQQQKQHNVMTILTPVYPYINSAYNVSNCTFTIIEEQLKLANIIMQKICLSELQWSDLLKKIQFFDIYYTYLQIRALSKNKDDLIQWKSHIESKLRKLNKMLDEGDVNKAIEFHLYPKSFQTDYVQGDENDIPGSLFNFSESFYYGIRIKDEELVKEKLDIENIIRQFCDCLEGQKPYFRVPENLNLEIKSLHKDQIPKKIKSEL